MTGVVFHYDDGRSVTVPVTGDRSVMQIAVSNAVDGIVGECGGTLMCATCHVYVDDDCLDLVGEPGEVEDEMLDMALSPRKDNSRLSCQLRVSGNSAGLSVTVPAEN